MTPAVIPFQDPKRRFLRFEREIERAINRVMHSGSYILGAEGAGMRQLTKKTCDQLVRIPMQGAVESLNVSVAAGVCLFEAMRQRRG